MARHHDQSGIPNFDLAPTATLSTAPAVSDELLISRSFQVARTQSYVPMRREVRAIASQWVDNAHSRQAACSTLCARPGARNG